MRTIQEIQRQEKVGYVDASFIQDKERAKLLAPFSEVIVEAPNVYLRFRAKKERINRVLEVLLKEAREAEEEFEQIAKQLTVQPPPRSTSAPPSDANDSGRPKAPRP